MDSTKLPTNRILVNRTQPISQEGSLHGSTHAQKEALSVLLTEETLLLENQKNGKGTERTDHSRTGVSQAHFKQIWDIAPGEVVIKPSMAQHGAVTVVAPLLVHIQEGQVITCISTSKCRKAARPEILQKSFAQGCGGP